MTWFDFMDKHPVTSVLYAFIACITLIGVSRSIADAIIGPKITDMLAGPKRAGLASSGAKSPAWKEAREAVAKALDGTKYDWTWIAEDDSAAVLMMRKDPEAPRA